MKKSGRAGCCYVANCRSGSEKVRNTNKKTGVKNPGLFSPLSEETRLRWQNSIGRSDKPLTLRDVVCELHFRQEDVERDYVTTMPDGKVFRLQRGSKKVKSGAVPTLFPESSPTNLICVRKQKAIPEKTFEQSLKKVKISQNISDPDPIAVQPVIKEEPIDNFFLEIENVTTVFNICDVNTKLVQLPSKYWLKGKINDNLIFTCWKADLTKIIKRVVIYEDKKTRVYLSEEEVHVEEIEEINSIECIEKLLFKVHTLTPCVGSFEQEKSPNCIGYVENRVGANVRFHSRCAMCKKHRLNLQRIQRRHLKKIDELTELGLMEEELQDFANSIKKSSKIRKKKSTATES